jgi:hypothetical protein
VGGFVVAGCAAAGVAEGGLAAHWRRETRRAVRAIGVERSVEGAVVGSEAVEEGAEATQLGGGVAMPTWPA